MNPLPQARDIIIFFNDHAQGGRGRKHWEKILPALQDRFGQNGEFLKMSPKETISLAMAQERPYWVSIGGDGTLFETINQAMMLSGVNPELKHKIKIGAIGIGSSNDAQKPFSSEVSFRCAGFPARLDFENSRWHDIIQVDFNTGPAQVKTKYFNLNASLGITAQANAVFNEKSGVLGFLQRVSIPISILATAASTLARAKSHSLKIQFLDLENETHNRILQTHNVALIKSRFFSGDFRYPDQPLIDDGALDLHFVNSMSRIELWRCLGRLARGKFLGQPKTFSHRIRSCMIDSPNPIPFEMDGEVFWTHHLEVKVHRKALMLCPRSS